MSKVLSSVLLVTILVGTLFFLFQRNRLAQITPDFERLSALVGVLDVKDSSKYLVTRVEQDSNYRFYWRLFVPETIPQPETRNYSFSGFSTSPIMYPAEMSLTINVREIEGRVAIYLRTETSESVVNFPHDLDPFLVEHWDDLEFDLLADDEPVEIDPTKVVQVIRIRMPKELVEELPASVAPAHRKFLQEGRPLFEYALGDKASFQKQKLGPR